MTAACLPCGDVNCVGDVCVLTHDHTGPHAGPIAVPGVTATWASRPTLHERARLQAAYEQAVVQTDLIARLTLNTIADLRRTGTVLDPAVQTVLDRFEEAVYVEEFAAAQLQDAQVTA